MKNTTLASALIISCILLVSCQNKEHKYAETIAENFMKEYLNVSLKIKEDSFSGYDREDSLLYSMYDGVDDFVLSNPHFKPLLLDSYSINSVYEADNTIFASYKIKGSVFNQVSSERDIVLAFNIDSLKKNRESTKIEYSRGLVDFKDYKFNKYYSEYLDGHNDDKDFNKRAICIDIDAGEWFIQSYIEENLTTANPQIQYNDDSFISGWINIINNTEYEFPSIPVKLTYLDKNNWKTSNTDDVISETTKHLRVKIKPNSKTYCEWFFPNLRSAKSYILEVDYQSNEIQLFIRSCVLGGLKTLY